MRVAGKTQLDAVCDDDRCSSPQRLERGTGTDGAGTEGDGKEA